MPPNTKFAINGLTAIRCFLSFRFLFWGSFSLALGGRVASWLASSTPERAVWVRALARDIVLCSWANHFSLALPLSTQVYKWVPVNCWGKPNKLRRSNLQWTSIPSRGTRKTSASCYRSQDKFQRLRASLGSKASSHILAL